VNDSNAFPGNPVQQVARQSAVWGDGGQELLFARILIERSLGQKTKGAAVLPAQRLDLRNSGELCRRVTIRMPTPEGPPPVDTSSPCFRCSVANRNPPLEGTMDQQHVIVNASTAAA